MKRILPVAVLAAAALAVAACDKPLRTQSAYNNSGQSATPAMPATTQPSQPATVPSTQPLGEPSGAQDPAANERQATTSPATSDRASPNTAPPAR